MLNRRELLGTALAGASLGPAALARATWSRPSRADDRVLVLLQLRGGNDGLNTLVPFEDDVYHRARPNLALDPRSVHRIDEQNGFHPELPRLTRRFGEGGLAVVRGVGYPASNLSHFRSQDIWEAATTHDPMPAHGWMGNFCDAHLEGAPPTTMLAIGRDSLPHSMRARTVTACAVPSLQAYRIRSAPRGAADEEAEARRRAMDALNPVAADGSVAHVTSAVAAARRSIEELARTERVDSRVEYPKSPLARDLNLVARAITKHLPTRFFYVTQDGYDTHAAQAGAHRTLLGQLDAALDAFLTDLERQGELDRVLVMTISDFGRRVAESGVGATTGTDHGAASDLFLAGSRVRGGLHGAQPDLGDLDENGNLPMRIDFRRVYAEVIGSWLGGDADRVLGAHFEPLALVQS